MRPVVTPEPMFWVALVAALLAVPLLVTGAEAPGGDPHIFLAAVVLFGAAAAGFGLTLVLGAYGPVPLRRTLVVSAVLAAAIAGTVVAFLSADQRGLLGAWSFFVILVDGIGVAVLPRAWRLAEPVPLDAPSA